MKLPHTVIVVDWGLTANRLPFTDNDGANPPPLDPTETSPEGGNAALKAAFVQYKVACLVKFEGFEDVSENEGPDPDRRFYGLVRNRSIWNMTMRKDTYDALRAAMKASRDAAVATDNWSVKSVKSGNVAATGNPPKGTLTSDVPFMEELGIYEDPDAALNPFGRTVLGRARQIAAYGLDGGPSTFWGRGVEMAAYYERGQVVQVKLELLYDRL